MGGVESNPGPNHATEEGFLIRSQNCRGLTNRNKLFKMLRKLFPNGRGQVSSRNIACLQETHCIDTFVIDHYFKGTAIIDNGERNQRGVCSLIPESFEVCSSHTSGLGRWAIAVIRSRNVPLARKYVLVNVYAPNCHREAATFYQDLFRSLDEITSSLTQLNENFDIAVVGDFNVVLDYNRGASDRTGSRAERDLARLVKESMIERDMFETVSAEAKNSFTWRRGSCLSKLDYIFLSSALFARSNPVKTQWHEFGANLDHAAISVQIRTSMNSVRGRSFPKLFKTDIHSEQDRNWLREQISLQENQIPAHWNAHLRLDFVKMILRSKALELRQMKKFENSCASVREEINSLVLQVPLNDERVARLDFLKMKLHELEEVESEMLSIRAGVKWREEGEKSTSYFLAKFKAKSESAVMHSLNVGTRIITGSQDILSAVQQFYNKLYNKPSPPKLSDGAFVDEFFANCPSIEREHKLIMARPLQLEELKEALKSCKESAPGMDGIPYSYYKAFPDLLKYVLASWEFAIQSGSLADSHKKSCISLLPKKGKDLTLIGNWRPISLSPCDLKIITKAYANRLKIVLPNILSDAQAAYIPGRDINFNNRLIRQARAYAVKNNLDYCVVSLDAQKAFDSVSHEFLIKVLEVYGFPQEFILVFRTLYEGLSSVVQVNGFLSNEFKIANGVKQGDALSCGLFVLAIDPLLRNLSSNAHIQGLDIPVGPMDSEEIKIFSYADDVTIICKNRGLQDIFSEYERFSKVSGLVLNADKTEVFNLIQSPIRASRVEYLGNHYILGRLDRIRLCGMWLAAAEAEDYQLNVLNRIDDMEAIVLSWGRRRVTLNGRMILAKTFLMSLIVFPAQFVKIRPKEVKRIEKLVYSFVNGARNLYGPERIARTNLKAPRELGGINGIDVDSFIQAIAVKQFVKADRSHKVLKSLQLSNEIPVDGVGYKARELLKQNYNRFAGVFVIPDLQQIEAISGIPLSLALRPNSQASMHATRYMIDSLGALQQFINRNQHGRAISSSILKALPRPFSNLIRAQHLVPAPVKIVWFSSDSVIDADCLRTKSLKQALIERKFPELKVRLHQIYKRTDWPPPGLTREYDSTPANIWEIKNPTLRSVRLKVLYKDVFSNERRFRFGLTASPSCEICGQIETVEHHLFSCQNATRLWNLFHRMTGINIVTMFDVLMCSNNLANEIVKTIILKALIQIDRSKDKTDREIISQCIFFIKIEARTHASNASALMQLANALDLLP